MSRNRNAPRNPVKLASRYASLAEDFGLDWGTKLFGQEAINSVPKYQRGPKKGKPKAFVHWRKAENGGWCRECQGVVGKGQIVDAWIGVGPYSGRSDAMQGKWLGRIQPMAGSTYFLFEKGRAQEAERVARAQADFEEEREEIRQRLAGKE